MKYQMRRATARSAAARYIAEVVFAIWRRLVCTDTEAKLWLPLADLHVCRGRRRFLVSPICSRRLLLFVSLPEASGTTAPRARRGSWVRPAKALSGGLKTTGPLPAPFTPIARALRAFHRDISMIVDTGEPLANVADDHLSNRLRNSERGKLSSDSAA
jgi:hypothetical protein